MGNLSQHNRNGTEDFMKTKLLMLGLTLVFVSVKSFASCGGKGGGGSEIGELADIMLPLTITTSPPTGTTSLLSCAEVNPEMVLREATMVGRAQK